MCNTETGVAVRAGIFDARFWSNAAAVAAPFPVVMAVIATLHFGRKPLDWLRRGRAVTGRKAWRSP